MVRGGNACSGTPRAVVIYVTAAPPGYAPAIDLHLDLDVKPRLRGWLHALTVPLALAAGIVLVTLSPTDRAQWAAAVFGITAVLMFGVSAVYHRGTWSPRWYGVLRRWDHANIFLVIAGTYTPFAIVMLEGRSREVLLWVVWTGALGGVFFRVVWLGAPRWLYVPVYVGLGWVAVFFVPELLDGGGVGVLVLVFGGGALYSLGGLVYALERPNPWPRHFGFHEVFHLLTILGFSCHYVAISLATYD